MQSRLLLATGNRGKVREYQTLLAGVPFELVTLADVGIDIAVEETGKTYEENAKLKAIALTKASRLVSLADDSGLEVDALNGEPGALSARYAGENASDNDRINFLLSRMREVPWERRTASFHCVIALAMPDGQVVTCKGECPGMIALEPCGELGFGYDPIFYFPELGKTMAELPLEVKNRISHRGRAAGQARKVLQRLSI